MVLLCMGMTAWGNPTSYTYSFDGITNNTPANVVIGEAQLFMDVTAYGSNQVMFTFRNTGPQPSFIAAIYFKDGSLLAPIAYLQDVDDSIASVFGDPNVDFSEGTSGNGLPGGDSTWKISNGFIVDDASADSPGTNKDGVDPGEWLAIVFNLQSGSNFGNVIYELDNDELQIGLHVQGIGTNSGSESFANNGRVTVPVPAGVLLVGVGVSLVGWLRRRRMV